MPWVLQIEGRAHRVADSGPYTVWMILSPATLFSSATLVAAGAYVLAALWPRPANPAPDDRADVVPQAHQVPKADAAWWLLALGWLAQAVAIATDGLDWQHQPLLARFGFGPALSVTTWLVLGVYALERLQLDSLVARRALAVIAASSVVLAAAFPGQVHPTQHALAPIHWVLGLASYGLFGAALLHAAFLTLAERRMKRRLPPAGIPLLRLESLTLRFVWAGFVVLSATLLLGYLFAQPWRWDHKSVLSVLSWLVFATLLAGRHWMGWRGKTAAHWLYAGSALLLLAYVGSRFVLEVLLHRAPGLG